MIKKKIIILSPSDRIGKASIEKFNTAIENIKSNDFDIEIYDNVYSKGKAPSPQEKATDILTAFNSDADYIWASSGGNGVTEVCRNIDFKEIKKDKIFIGFSDNCSISYMLATKCDMPSIYAYNVKAMSSLSEDRKKLFEMMEGGTKFSSYNYWENENVKPELQFYNFNKEYIEGKIIGGIVENMSDICGSELDTTSEYIEKNKNVILFLEAYKLSPTNLKIRLEKLKQFGWFDNITGFIISRSFNYCNKEKEVSTNNIYTEILLPYNKPMILNMDISHMYPSTPIYYGKMVKIRKEDNKAIFEYEKQ